jgi:hypothetical protein
MKTIEKLSKLRNLMKNGEAISRRQLMITLKIHLPISLHLNSEGRLRIDATRRSLLKLKNKSSSR